MSRQTFERCGPSYGDESGRMPKAGHFAVRLVAQDAHGETVVVICQWRLRARSLASAKLEVDGGVWHGPIEGHALEIADSDGNVLALTRRGDMPYLGPWTTLAK